MYAKGKGSSVPSDAQAREKLALYVYEYLLHVGAQKSAQTFLSEQQSKLRLTGDQQGSSADTEIRWEKNITLGEPPGFLHSWWCVFWDLYCAAPERRDTCDHSSEAKAFHDYGFVNSGYGMNGMSHNPSAPSPLSQMPPNQDGMPGGPGMPPGFFPPFMSPRYPGGPRGPGIRMQPDQFNGPPGGVAGQMPMSNSMEPRPGQMPMSNSMEPRPGHPGMGPMQRMGHPGGRMSGAMNPLSPLNPALNHPGGRISVPLNPASPINHVVYDSMGPNYGPGIRGPPPNSMSPGGPGPGDMQSMSMHGGGRAWPPSSSSSSIQRPPGTPIMPSPQDSTSSGDGLYGMMKSGQGSMSGMPGGYHGMPGNPDGGMGMGSDGMPPVMNGDIDSMKNSPANGPGTPRDDLQQNGNGPGPDMGGYPLGYPDNEGGVSAAILKIKESMQEEAKRFEKEGDHLDYFMSQ